MNDRRSDRELEGEIALVTGASSGIGRATALLLARSGARVAALARSVDALEALCREARDAIIPVPCDLEHEESIERAIADVAARLGSVSILVNNAGHIEPRPLEVMEIASWDRHFAVNVRAAFIAIRLVLPHMRKAEHGAIVNVSSISGVAGPEKFPGFTAYGASKAALIALTELLAVEIRGSGVRVNCISPGSVATPMLRRVAPSLEADMTPDEVAESILFLASPRSAAINGQNVHVYGN
ncbi:MAG: SDR family oxidoreductase [Thermoanaerobaculia bacterium]|jgi:NAD(P)-dependent dehydrogenase (short-subunit alcohol dehydrogenase family)